MVRGFALFGVLLVNMYNFGAYSPEWSGPVDRFFMAVMHGFFETKSWRLFSMLFGFGFLLQMLKAEKYEGSFLIVYLRRLVILFVIGMGHALFYDGDILMEYSMLGLILIPFRRIPPRIVFISSVALLAVFPIGHAFVSVTQPADLADDEDAVSLAERREGHPYLGSAGDVIEANSEAIPPLLYPGWYGPESSLSIFAMFLFGLYVGRRRILHDIPSHLTLIRKACGWGLSVGLLSVIGEVLLRHTLGYEVFRASAAPLGIQILGDFLFTYGSTGLSIGYAAGIVLLSRRENWLPALNPLGSVGRLALTVYLSGTLLFTLLFYGYGFGQLFLLGPAEVTGYAVLFFGLQIWFCVWWARRFRFGPTEWIWRSLTYLQIQPMKLAR